METEVYSTEPCMWCGFVISGTTIVRDLDDNGAPRLRFDRWRLPHSESECARFTALAAEEWPYQAT